MCNKEKWHIEFMQTTKMTKYLITNFTLMVSVENKIPNRVLILNYYVNDLSDTITHSKKSWLHFRKIKIAEC